MSIPAEENAFSDQEFSGNLDVQARKGVSRREFLRLAGISGAGLALSTCTPPQVVVAEQLPASTQTSEAEQAATAAASATAKAEADKKKTQAATKTATPTSTPSPAPTATETPKPTEVPIEIVGVEVRSVAQNKAVLEKLQQNPTVKRLTDGADLRHNKDGVVTDVFGKVSPPDLVPATAIITIKTNDGKEQQLVIVRHPEQDPKTLVITQQAYLIVGHVASEYIDPTRTEPANISAVKITRRNGAWFVPSPDQSGSEMVLAKMDTEKGTVTSPFGGNFDFSVNDVHMFGLEGALDYANHTILPLDLMYKLFDQTELTPNHPVLGDQNESKQVKLPTCWGPEWVYGGRLYDIVQYYLEVEHPELVTAVLGQHPEISFEHKKDEFNKDYWQYHWKPLDMSPILRINFMNLGFNDVIGQNSSQAYIEVIPDKSQRGWGVLIHIGVPREPNYAFTDKSMPKSLFSLRDNQEEMMAAAQQLTDPKNPNFGVISPLFGRNFIH